MRPYSEHYDSKATGVPSRGHVSFIPPRFVRRLRLVIREVFASPVRDMFLRFSHSPLPCICSTRSTTFQNSETPPRPVLASKTNIFVCPDSGFSFGRMTQKGL